ncbi:hypothetical protein Pmar_PMAR006528 [Perkinsus marinus ATCC 50983]|uniref:Uncharacterized protein n=1 Tax=Perkinsus marinus (strain ATCC 50983 / TXsc) TaxID=423536 RepID=C5LTP4_PERM5|nr:hypothetical protein Pmar_PMAR006528 [Perkinsus marinus ATCC 50983]EEQ99856.1 hypothetical protein Pmar_PMAR006528 [Perkinsus marinus ATCC 50983]|eukprot:XP_002767139.1 hypothetical protein Pmar_PMAR006528 [Perkinsus marinus ATCC 50983]
MAYEGITTGISSFTWPLSQCLSPEVMDALKRRGGALWERKCRMCLDVLQDSVCGARGGILSLSVLSVPSVRAKELRNGEQLAPQDYREQYRGRVRYEGMGGVRLGFGLATCFCSNHRVGWAK